MLTDAFDVRGSFSWSPDGQWIVFAGRRQRSPHVSSRSGVRRFSDTTDEWHLLAPVVVARRQVHRVLRAGPGCPDAGEGHDTRREAVSVPGTVGQLSNGESVSFRAWRTCLIYLKEGDLRHQNFFRVDLSTGEERQISEFRSGFEIRDFDIAPDGSRILFDRLRANSDVVLIRIGWAIVCVTCSLTPSARRDASKTT